jgi:hypothetical protein
VAPRDATLTGLQVEDARAAQRSRVPPSIGPAAPWRLGRTRPLVYLYSTVLRTTHRQGARAGAHEVSS